MHDFFHTRNDRYTYGTPYANFCSFKQSSFTINNISPFSRPFPGNITPVTFRPVGSYFAQILLIIIYGPFSGNSSSGGPLPPYNVPGHHQIIPVLRTLHIKKSGISTNRVNTLPILLLFHISIIVVTFRNMLTWATCNTIIL